MSDVSKYSSAAARLAVWVRYKQGAIHSPVRDPAGDDQALADYLKLSALLDTAFVVASQACAPGTSSPLQPTENGWHE